MTSRQHRGGDSCILARRRLLASLGLAVGAGVGVTRWGGWWTPSAPLTLRLTALVRDVHGARVVGEVYLRQAPHESGSRQLASLILDGRTGGGLTDEALRRLLLSGVQRDFEQERTVVLDGWILSRTEARLCALVTRV